METEVLRTIELGKVYGKGKNACQALKNVNITIEKGEFVGIMGPSGSGKSTFLNLISTIDRPTEGQVLLEGKDIFSMNDKELAEFRKKKLGFVFQDYNLLEQMNVYENITLPLALSKVSAEEQRERAYELAEFLNIRKLIDKYPSTLSGGEKQRVSVARALIMELALLLADEPTGALDSNSGKMLMEMLRDMNEKRGVTILIVTHAPLVAEYCKRIIEIQDGTTKCERDNAGNAGLRKQAL